METKLKHSGFCKICDKKLVLIKTRIGRGGKNRLPIAETVSSLDGVLFYAGGFKCWFCNSCWEKILTFSKIQNNLEIVTLKKLKGGQLK